MEVSAVSGWEAMKSRRVFCVLRIVRPRARRGIAVGGKGEGVSLGCLEWGGVGEGRV